MSRANHHLRLVVNGKRLTQREESLARFTVFCKRGPCTAPELLRALSPDRAFLSIGAVDSMLRVWTRGGCAERREAHQYAPVMSPEQFAAFCAAQLQKRATAGGQASARRHAKKVANAAKARVKRREPEPARVESPNPVFDRNAPAFLRGLV